MIILYFAALVFSFALLFKCADFFVDGACGIANIMNIPRLVIGIVLVGLATTAPEFGVSVYASFLGQPELALGNAIGSVICDDGVALAFAAILAPVAILVKCRTIRIFGAFLLSIDFLAYWMARNGVLSRIEGILLLGLLLLYFLLLFKNPNFRLDKDTKSIEHSNQRKCTAFRDIRKELRRPAMLFLIGLAGVVLTSRAVVWAAKSIASHFAVSEIVIGATVVAIGTSLPEISTCITAALKGEGEIAVGNILGADVLNVLWIIGVASVVRPIAVDVDIINFAFPYMILIVTVMLVSMLIGCRLGKIKGVILFLLYLIYLGLTLKLFV
jgi:cation:H+ antiporter